MHTSTFCTVACILCLIVEILCTLFEFAPFSSPPPQHFRSYRSAIARICGYSMHFHVMYVHTSTFWPSCMHFVPHSGNFVHTFGPLCTFQDHQHDFQCNATPVNLLASWDFGTLRKWAKARKPRYLAGLRRIALFHVSANSKIATGLATRECEIGPCTAYFNAL